MAKDSIACCCNLCQSKLRGAQRIGLILCKLSHNSKEIVRCHVFRSSHGAVSAAVGVRRYSLPFQVAFLLRIEDYIRSLAVVADYKRIQHSVQKTNSSTAIAARIGKSATVLTCVVLITRFHS